MKWSLEIAFEVKKGRQTVFSLRNLIPAIKRWHREHKLRIHGCFAKSRYTNRQNAMNAEWFRKRPTVWHDAYECDVCDGWHITTKGKK
jgi:hypothetical protein